jgi:hypothetical protein
MSAIEDRLREALSERASHAPVDPDAWSRTLARSRRRGGRIRAGLLAPVAAAAAVAAIVIGVTSAVSPSAPVRTSTAPGSPSRTATPSPAGTPCHVQGIQARCASGIVRVTRGSGRQGTVTSFFFGYLRTPGAGTYAQSLSFCALTGLQQRPPPNSAGPDGGGNCADASLTGYAASTQAGPILNLQYGLAARQVASVTALLTNGRKVPGVVVSGRGFPHRAWLVSYPKHDPATLLFYDAAGRQVSKLFVAAYDQDFVPPAHGGIGLFSTKLGLLQAYLVKGLVTFFDSDSWNGGYPVTGWPAVTGLLGSTYGTGGNWCFGYVQASVARVVIELDNGYQVSDGAFQDGWPGSGVQLFTLKLPQALFPRGPDDGPAPQGTVIAYDQSGRVIAREPLISVSV